MTPASASTVQGPRALNRHGQRTPRLLLPLVFALIGAALALSFMSIDLAVASALTDADQPASVVWPLVAVVAVVPPTLIGLIPAVRQVEATAVSSLLGTDFGGRLPGPARTWDQRWRSVTWFWGHLTAGAAVGAIVVMATIFGSALAAGPFVLDRGDHILDVGWAEVTHGWRDAVYLVAAAGVLVVAAVALLVVVLVLRSLAPPLLGPSVSERIAELDTQTTQLVERTRLARELHDSVGHALSVVVLQSAAARRRLARDPDGAATSIAAVEDVAKRALTELDEVLGLLRDEDRPAAKRPLHGLDSLESLITAVRGTGLSVETDLRTAGLADVPPVVSREAYRIVQEGLTNAMRHAPGSTVTVRVGRDRDLLQISVANPVDAQSRSWRSREGGGRGITGMRERCRILGGTVTSSAARGTWTLRADLPLPAVKEQM
ncbi:sensor histidine kinase [Luteipulveratus flavus]|uniref:histidine kinase n=1 Tax=Luteipulveratus flavus TaxID=3031728 RepID=A0ABT6CAX3_9MICO|nr:histidine kinase [Luteipulveratus sp. YIM 133296]MDF8265482.1 histidine kinase [Luteipulveratus sp. YIM 133296]